MKFCKECGTTLDISLQFCSNCGKKIDNAKENVVQQENIVTEEKQKKSKWKSSFAISVAVIVALLFGAYQFGAYQFSKEKQVKSFIQAVEKQDTKALVSMMQASDTRVKITEGDVKSYLRYMKENPSYYDGFISYLNTQTVDGLVVKKEDSFPDAQVVEKGKKWMLYPVYKLQVQAYYMDVQTNAKDTTIYVNDKEIGKIKNADFAKEVGPYFPGIHRVKAVAKSDLTTLESEKEVELAGKQDGKVEVELPLEGHYVIIESDQDDATIYVNGEKRGKLDDGSYELGPVSTDETVEVHLEKKFSWGVSATESVKIGTDSSYYLEFPTQVSETEVGEFVHNHIRENVRAINLNDFSLIEDHYNRSGKGYETDREYLKYLFKKGITEELLQFEVRDVKRTSTSEYTVKTYEEYYIHYGDGSTKFKSFHNEHFVTVTKEGKILYHSLGKNETLKTENISGPTGE
ncbi:membrane protein [Bacillus manliponensis]|uniref:Membrane protein n=1 Tax=Bacillus manliponensis TaxID=574376 RepID=A0A073K4K0_9BACI|nr:membrane protein [Bacillus manliponensis]KEK21392.1 membrane protein [Bacillus manliponensis]